MNEFTKYTETVMQLSELEAQKAEIDRKIKYLNAQRSYLNGSQEVKSRISELIDFESGLRLGVSSQSMEKLVSAGVEVWSLYNILSTIDEIADSMELPETKTTKYRRSMLKAIGMEPTRGRLILAVVYNDNVEEYVDAVIAFKLSNEA